MTIGGGFDHPYASPPRLGRRHFISWGETWEIMKYLSIKNWETFQHYKERTPPWIKLHRDLLRDYNFSCLQDASKLHLMLIWLLASQLDNKIPADAEFIRKQIGVSGEIDFNELISKGFLIDDSGLLAGRKQVAILETETETETETDKKEDTIVSSKKNLNGCRIDYFLTNHPDGGIDSQNCPDDLGNWAIQEFKWDVPKTVGVWAGFCDYWLAKTGAGATKRDWPATWRNWCRKAAEHDARSDYILTQQAKRSYAK